MRVVWWMAAASAASAAVAGGLMGRAGTAEVLAGMAGPLVAASVSWPLMERTYRRRPERLTAVIMAAFAGKMVFFGAYVAVMVIALSLRPVPFAASFTAYFVGLHLAEALCLRQLYSDGTRAPR